MKYFVNAAIALVALQAGQPPAFEVAAVKPANRDVLAHRGFECGFARGRFHALGSAQWIIACAYQITQARASQEIAGGPAWLNEDLFDIEARAPEDRIPRSQADGLPMLQALLAERFKLVVHREAKDVPMYALVVARRDGRLGPRLRPAPKPCADWLEAGRRGPAPDIPGDLNCLRGQVTVGAIRSLAMPLSQFANLLSPRLDRPLVDRTGLSGLYAIDLQWKPEQAGPADSGADNLPTSIVGALLEQLGLKLEPTTGPMNRLVIDHLERPVAN